MELRNGIKKGQRKDKPGKEIYTCFFDINMIYKKTKNLKKKKKKRKKERSY